MNLLSKICGLRESANIEQIITSQRSPDLYGFIFHPASPRYVSTGMLPLLTLTTQPIATKRVGVFVDPEMNEILEIHRQFPLAWIQLHGNETPAFCQQVRAHSFTVIKMVHLQNRHSQTSSHAYEGSCDFFLFDTPGKAPGGNGQPFNWEHLQGYEGNTPFFLSGGITPQHLNQLKAIKHPKFYGVDMNSGFELAAGRKDPALLNAFLKALS